MSKNENKIIVLGKTFNSEEERRSYYREELRKKLPELKKMEGFPIGHDEDILNLSDPPFYTACPNPWLNDFISIWEEEKLILENKGVRFSNFKISEPFPGDIKAGKNHALYNAHTYHTKVPHEITTKYLLYYTQPGDVVIDTFAGTGMTGVGASYCETIEKTTELIFKNDFKRIGANFLKGKRNCINIDLSSIASHISHVHNTSFDVSAFDAEYAILLKRILEEKKHYKTKHDTNISGDIKYTVFSQLYNCNNCHNSFDYFSAAYENITTLRSLPKCPNCGFEEKKSNLSPVFKTQIDSISGEAIHQIEYLPISINYSIDKKRFTKIVSEVDVENANNIEILYPNKIPNQELIEGVETQRNEKYGYNKIHHFYTKRTLHFISVYLKTIESFSQKNHFIFLLTAILPKLTKLNRYMPQHGSRALVGPMANTLYLPPIFVENNFIDQLEFQFKKVRKALAFVRNQVVSQQSATYLKNIKDESVDYVFIDPPFGANIMYSELNNLSESWLKVLTNNKDEAIESKGQNKSKFDYERLMIYSFKELFRVLKPGSWMTVEFSNTSAAIWNIIQNGLNATGFVLAKVDALNKTRGGLHAMLGPVAVKQDLVITCYKPSSTFWKDFSNKSSSDNGIWAFIENHLEHLPIHVVVENATTEIIERSPKILFDRLVAFYIQQNLPVPIDATKFQMGLRERFIERDKMFFNDDQVHEYDRKKAETPEFIQLNIFVANEQDSIYWLKNLLENGKKTEQEIHPLWMKEVAGNMRNGDVLPEMRIVLEENFLKDDNGCWYVPNSESEADLEKLRNKRLLKQFEVYKNEIANPRVKIKEARVEALRAGFKQCYQDKDFKTIVTIGDRIPNNLLMEDEVLLQFYDIASSRI
jgi:DNA modification methylase